MRKISIVCGSFHKDEIERMVDFAHKQCEIENLQVSEVIWVPGAMEVPLALARLIENGGIDGLACLGIIEKGSTQHGLAMGQAVIKSIIEIQLSSGLPIGLGIIGPGAEPKHIEPRIEPHARAAISAISSML